MRRIAVTNQKGGVGKTTTVANLSAALAAEGQRVLMVDLDPQAHLSLHFGVAADGNQPSAYTVLLDSQPVREAIRPLDDRLWLLPSQIDLVGAEVELASVVGREMILREAMAGLEHDYDFMVIDCPPSLGVLTLNGLATCNEVLVPLQPHFLALQGLGKLFETVLLVTQRVNPELKVTGVVICMHEQGTRLAGEICDDLAAFLKDARGRQVPWSAARIFTTIIRRNIRLAECPSHAKSIFAYAPRSNGAADYLSLARELVNPSGVSTGSAETLRATPDEAPQPAATEGSGVQAAGSKPTEAVPVPVS